METTTNKTTGLKRGRRLGDNFVGLTEGESIHVLITGKDFGTFTSKNYPEGLTYVEVENLETQQPAKLWVSGGLEYLIEKENLFGKAVEIVHAGKKPTMVTIDGKAKETLVNQYEIYSLEQ